MFGRGEMRRVASITIVTPLNALAGPLTGVNATAGNPVSTLTVEELETVVLTIPLRSLRIVDPATRTGSEGTGVAAITIWNDIGTESGVGVGVGGIAVGVDVFVAAGGEVLSGVGVRVAVGATVLVGVDVHVGPGGGVGVLVEAIVGVGVGVG